MISVFQALSNYAGVAFEFDYVKRASGKEDVVGTISLIPGPSSPPASAIQQQPDQQHTGTEEASTNTEEPAHVTKEHVQALELRVHVLEEQLKDLTIRLLALERK